MSGNRAFKQIANNLSGSDYIKNKKSKAIYKTYRGSPDKINKNVRIEENSLASAESYEMLNLITNGKDITYTMSSGEGTAAMSLQNLKSSNDTWKGSLQKSEDGKVNLVAQNFNESLYLQSIYGTNGTVGCVNEDSTQLSFTCCGTAGTSTSHTQVPIPSSTAFSFADMSIHPGSSEDNSVSLNQVYHYASYYEYTADPDYGITVITDGDKVKVALSSQVAFNSTFTVTVTPFNKCRESGTNTSKTFQVTAKPILPLPSVTSTNATQSVVTSTTDSKDYVLYTFDNTADNVATQGTLSIDFSGTTSNTLKSNVLLVAGGGSGAMSKLGNENYNFNYKAGAGGGGAGGGAYGTIDFTSTYNSIAVEVGKGGTGVATAEAMLTEYGVSGVAGDPTILSMNTNSNTSTIIKTFGGGGGNFVGSVNSANGGCTGGSSGVYNEVVEGSYTGSLFPSQSAQSNVPDLSFSFTSLSQKGGTSDSENGGGGGGGAGTAGSNGTSTKGGDGGDGFLWNITGSHYGGGGGGSGPDGNQGIDKIGTGGLGGGGTGADPYVVTVNGTNGLGGGGCAGFINHVYEGDGGSGVCIFAFKKSSIQ